MKQGTFQDIVCYIIHSFILLIDSFTVSVDNGKRFSYQLQHIWHILPLWAILKQLSSRKFSPFSPLTGGTYITFMWPCNCKNSFGPLLVPAQFADSVCRGVEEILIFSEIANTHIFLVVNHSNYCSDSCFTINPPYLSSRWQEAWSLNLVSKNAAFIHLLCPTLSLNCEYFCFTSIKIRLLCYSSFSLHFSVMSAQPWGARVPALLIIISSPSPKANNLSNICVKYHCFC